MRKRLLAAAVIFILLLGFNSCKSYKMVTVKNQDFLSDEKMVKDIGYYDLYVNHGTTSFHVKDPKIQNRTITGTLEPVDQSKVLMEPKNHKEAKAHKKDINIHLEKDPAELGAAGQPVTITTNDIARIDMYATDKKGLFATTASIILLLCFGVALVAGLIVLAIKGSDQAAQDSSGNSNSNSNSGGSSDGGGSNSGCYVATMVYGDYDAPEVLVLRRFRDRALAKSVPGRAFIRWYYAHSPGFVARYKHARGLNRAIRFMLNGFVALLSRIGFGR